MNAPVFCDDIIELRYLRWKRLHIGFRVTLDLRGLLDHKLTAAGFSRLCVRKEVYLTAVIASRCPFSVNIIVPYMLSTIR